MTNDDFCRMLRPFQMTVSCGGGGSRHWSASYGHSFMSWEVWQDQIPRTFTIVLGEKRTWAKGCYDATIMLLYGLRVEISVGRATLTICPHIATNPYANAPQTWLNLTAPGTFWPYLNLPMELHPELFHMTLDLCAFHRRDVAGIFLDKLIDTDTPLQDYLIREMR